MFSIRANKEVKEPVNKAKEKFKEYEMKKNWGGGNKVKRRLPSVEKMSFFFVLRLME